MFWKLFKGLCFAIGFIILAALLLAFLPFEFAGFLSIIIGVILICILFIIFDWSIAIFPFVAFLGIILWLILI